MEEELTPRGPVPAILGFLLLAGSLAAMPGSAVGPSVSVLVDFGDGTYLWADIVLPEENVTALKATDLAVAMWGLSPVEVIWYSFGAYVTDIGDRNPEWPAWWHFFLWNSTARAWDFSSVGPSSTNLTQGDSIGWYLAVDDPITQIPPRPVPRPALRDAHTSFRGDIRNTGAAHGRVPASADLLWETDVGILEIDTTPVVAYGNVYLGTRNALVALDAETGHEVWRNSRVRSLLSTPAIYDGRLILGGTD